MGRPSKDYTEREQQQDYKFQCILYPDSESYNCDILLNRLGSFWDHAVYIKHDKDFYTETEVDLWKAENKSDECPFEIGELKKPHYHVVAWTNKKPLLLGNAATKFDIESNLVQRTKSLRGSIRYLIHKDNPEKYQYSFEDLILIDIDEKEIQKHLRMDCDAMDKGKMIFDYIQTHERITLTQLTKFALESNCYDELRRGQHLWTAIIKEGW